MTPKAGGGKPPGLTPDEIRRYSRQIVIPELGVDGQLKLKNASVLVVGAGGLGSPAAIYLAAAGVGRIGLVDDDVVDLTNLHRQVLYATRDIGRKKVKAAEARLGALNPEVAIEARDTRISAGNAVELVRSYDIVLDGTDNFPARYLINDACVLAKKPMIYGGVLQFGGQVSVFGAPDGPCYRCMLREPPAGDVLGCGQAGVLGALPGIVGALQASEAIKLILGFGRPLVGRLLFCDALGAQFDEMPILKDPDCPVCGLRPTITSPVEYARPCRGPAPPAVEAGGRRPFFRPIGARELERMRRTDKDLLILDIREDAEVSGRPIPGALHIPKSRIESSLARIPRGRDIVVVCRVGLHSVDVLHFLADRGYGRLFNLEGGYLAWACGIDMGKGA